MVVDDPIPASLRSGADGDVDSDVDLDVDADTDIDSDAIGGFDADADFGTDCSHDVCQDVSMGCTCTWTCLDGTFLVRCDFRSWSCDCDGDETQDCDLWDVGMNEEACGRFTCCPFNPDRPG